MAWRERIIFSRFLGSRIDPLHRAEGTLHRAARASFSPLALRFPEGTLPLSRASPSQTPGPQPSHLPRPAPAGMSDTIWLGRGPSSWGDFLQLPTHNPEKKMFRTSYFLYLAVGSARMMLEESATRGKRKKRKKPRRTDNEWSFLFTPPFLFFVFDRLL